AGAFTWEKGQDVAIEAFRLLKTDLPSARLLLAGDGPLRRSMEQECGNAGSVQVLGFLADLESFMQSLDLFIMPSRSEGLGSSALMAMAYGVPVIASRTGGLPEFVAEGENGFLVQPRSPEALASAILRAARDRSSLRRMGAAARETARRFTSDIMTWHTMGFYRRCFKSSRKLRVESSK
ncbi:MAG: glycosyltransferase family 4 protein, partial [Terriglobia bacterium]